MCSVRVESTDNVQARVTANVIELRATLEGVNVGLIVLLQSRSKQIWEQKQETQTEYSQPTGGHNYGFPAYSEFEVTVTPYGVEFYSIDIRGKGSTNSTDRTRANKSRMRKKEQKNVRNTLL